MAVIPAEQHQQLPGATSPSLLEAADAPSRSRSGSSLGDRRVTGMEQLRRLQEAYARPEAERSNTCAADFARAGLKAAQGMPLFSSAGPPGVSQPDTQRSTSMPPSAGSIPGCVEEMPDADAATGTGGPDRLLLRELRELRRQMEEWVAQLLANQDQLLTQSQPRCASNMEGPRHRKASLGSDKDNSSEEESNFVVSKDSINSARPDILQPRAVTKLQSDFATFRNPVAADDISEVGDLPKKDTEKERDKEQGKDEDKEKLRCELPATSQTLGDRYTPWTNSQGFLAHGAFGSEELPSGTKSATPSKAKNGSVSTDSCMSFATMPGHEADTTDKPRRASSMQSMQSSASNARMLVRRTTLDAFRGIVTPKRAPKRLPSRGSAIMNQGDSPLQRFVHGRFFCLLVVALIAANNVFVALEMDSNARNQLLRLRASDHRHGTNSVGFAFAVAFAVEMVLRILADQRLFFLGPERHWNMSDLVLVVVGLLEQIGRGFWGSDELSVLLPNVTAVRLFRTVSLLRASHVPGLVKTMHHMRTMMFLILGSVGQLLRALVILFFVMYIFALIFMFGVVKYLENSSAETARILSIESNFGTFGSAIFTLFVTVSGGLDWYNFWEDVTELGSFYGMTFAFYVAFVIIGVLNVMTGVFVDSALQMAQADRDVAVAEQMGRKENYMHDLRELFNEADADESGSLSWNEFKEHLKDDRVKAYLSSLELDVTQARGLFKLLDTSQRDCVNIDEFVSGCMRLKGGAKSIDVCTLLYETRKMARIFTLGLKDVKHELRGLEKKVDVPTFRAGTARTRTEPPQLPLAGAASRPVGFMMDDSPRRPSMGALSSGSRPDRPEMPFSIAGFGPWAEETRSVEDEGSPLSLSPASRSPRARTP